MIEALLLLACMVGAIWCALTARVTAALVLAGLFLLILVAFGGGTEFHGRDW